VSAATAIPYAIIEGGEVAILRDGAQYTLRNPSQLSGSVAQLCRLARGQRIILRACANR
jgi:hypothetical protein